MKPRLIRVIDFGGSSEFAKASGAVVSTISSLCGETDRPNGVVEFVSAIETPLAIAALRAPADVIHITAHGWASPDEICISNHEGVEINLNDLAGVLADDGVPLGAPVLCVDTCDSAKSAFVRVIRDCIADETTYVGAKGSVNWYESTAYMTSFYASLLRRKGRGVTDAEAGWRAAQQADKAYSVVSGDARVPFRSFKLSPSRRARNSFQ